MTKQLEGSANPVHLSTIPDKTEIILLLMHVMVGSIYDKSIFAEIRPMGMLNPKMMCGTP